MTDEQGAEEPDRVEEIHAPAERPASNRQTADSPTLEDFNQVGDRLLSLPVDSFTYDVLYVPSAFTQEQRDAATNHVARAVVAALRPIPGCDLSSLRISANKTAEIVSDENKETSIFAISFGNPVFDFIIQMGPTRFHMEKQRTTLQNLLLTIPIFEAISYSLFEHVQVENMRLPALSLGAGLPFDPYNVILTWKYKLTLGKHLSDEDEATNDELFARLARLQAGGEGAGVPLGALDMEGFVRGDMTVGYTKVLEQRRRLLFVSFEGPWNVTRKDVDIRVQYEMGDSLSPLQEADYYDFRTPFLAFLRDEIFRKFFRELFANSAVVGRL